MYTGRLQRLVRESLKHKLSTAAWPVWGSLLNGVNGSMAELQRRAHYRMPKIYRMSVQFVVLTTLAADCFIIGTVVGRIFEQDYAYALGAAAFATILLLTLVVPTTLLVAACVDMEEPWGDSMMDVPGISYVRTAAEVTLNIAAPHPTTEPAVKAALSVDVRSAIQRATSNSSASDSGGRMGSARKRSPGFKVMAESAFLTASAAGSSTGSSPQRAESPVGSSSPLLPEQGSDQKKSKVVQLEA